MKLDNHTRLKKEGFSEVVITWQNKPLRDRITKKHKVLDIGCAAGKLSQLMPKESYYGVEYNDDLVKFAQEKGLRVKQCDISSEKLPFRDNTFDLVWFRHVIEHLQVREQLWVMREIRRVLKKDGMVVVFAPTPYHWFFWDNCTHVRPCTHGQLETLAKDCGFSRVEGKYSLIRSLPRVFQRLLRVTPLRFFLWEVYMTAEK